MSDPVTNPFIESNRDDSQAPPIGAVISERWELVDHIGEGGMSNVYKARHVIMQKLGAVKFLKGGLAQDPVAVKRFQQEALTAATLSHPNIVQMYDCGLCQYGVYLIMEILPGVSLYEIMDARASHAPDGLGILQLEEALPIFLQICDGLEHAHKKGIVHRDIKPSNIMLLEPDDEADKSIKLVVKLVDFGLAKMVGRDGTTGDGKLTATGEVFGSPVYMSPEHCLGQKLDGRSDIYSLGCLMYECVTGRKVLVGLTSTETMLRHVEEDADLRGLLEMKDPLARPMAEIIEKCLQRDPGRRYNDIGQLRSELLALQQGVYQAAAVTKIGNKLQPLTYGIIVCTVLAAVSMAVALYAVWPVATIASIGATPISMPILVKERKKTKLNMMSPLLVVGGEGLVAHLQLPPERKQSYCREFIKRADDDLADKRYGDAGKRFDFVINLLKDRKDSLPASNDLLLHAMVGQVVAVSEMKDLDGLDIGLGKLIKEQPEYFNATSEAKRYALEWRARVQKDNGSYGAAAATITQLLALYPDYSKAEGQLSNTSEEITRKALWTGLLADLLRLTTESSNQSSDCEMFADFVSALATLRAPSISDTKFAYDVATYRARLYYRYGLALLTAQKFPEADQAFQQSLAIFTEQGGRLVPEVNAAKVQSYLALKHFDWLESLKYRLENHI